MRHSIKTGFSFGLTSAVITTLGIMVGLSSGTHSKMVVTGGILTIAVADALSDALGIHLSEESEGRHTQKQVWTSTVCTFLTKFGVSITFAAPVLLLSLGRAVLVNIVWGFSLLAVFSYYIGRGGKLKSWKVVCEHVCIASAVIVATHYLGAWISGVFG